MLNSASQIALVLLLSSFASILAQLLKLPSILFLLCFGLSAGPILGLVLPDQLFGELLIPFVSISVGILLFEGGLTLHFQDFSRIGKTVLKLITVGMLVSFGCTTVLARQFLGTSWEVALLLGAITVVSGPTVVMPLLRQVRPSRPLGAILRWEGILIDPIGVLLTVIVFEAILDHTGGSTLGLVVSQVVSNLLVGALCGLGSGVIVSWVLERHLLADHLHIPFTLAILVSAQTFSDSVHAESGLLAATLMGFYMTNRCKVPVRSIVEFNETLRDILIGCLFILLGARLSPEAVSILSLESGIFLLLLIFLVRPLAVFVASTFEPLSLRQKLFLSFVAPRGIVAASVASLVSLRLANSSLVGATELLPYTFLVIVGTVIFYSLLAAPVGSLLGVRQAEPQGILLLGAHAFARELAKVICDLGFRVVLVDSNPLNVARSRELGLEVVHGNILSEEISEHLDLEELGKFLALSSNDEANSLAAVHFSPAFGKREVYQVAPNIPNTFLPSEKLRVQPYGRILDLAGISSDVLVGLSRAGAKLKKVDLAQDKEFNNSLGAPFLGITKDKRLVLATTDKKFALADLLVIVYLDQSANA